MIKIKISKNHEGKIRQGYPWVFDYQIQNQYETGEAGDLGVIYDARNKFLAIGLYDPESDIRLRILRTGSPVEIGEVFFRDRLHEAVKLRVKLDQEETTGYRILNGENDGFPGMILDRYGETGVIKLYSLAWLPYLDALISLFRETLPFKRCVLRLSRKIRKKRGTRPPLEDGRILFGESIQEPAPFKENGFTFLADVFRGAKTGFFLDQRDNRKRVQELSKGKPTLNVFSAAGAFSVYALGGGCRSVDEIEINPHALGLSRRIIKMNFPERPSDNFLVTQRRGNAFKILRDLSLEKKRYGLVILDPPVFAGNKKQKPKALKAYRELARTGGGLTLPGGYLFAASCSAPVSAEEFYAAVSGGLRDAGKSGEIILKTGHPLDHPVRFSEGSYLKGVYYRMHD